MIDRLAAILFVFPLNFTRLLPECNLCASLHFNFTCSFSWTAPKVGGEKSLLAIGQLCFCGRLRTQRWVSDPVSSFVCNGLRNQQLTLSLAESSLSASCFDTFGPSKSFSCQKGGSFPIRKFPGRVSWVLLPKNGIREILLKSWM